MEKWKDPSSPYVLLSIHMDKIGGLFLTLPFSYSQQSTASQNTRLTPYCINNTKLITSNELPLMKEHCVLSGCSYICLPLCSFPVCF